MAWDVSMLQKLRSSAMQLLPQAVEVAEVEKKATRQAKAKTTGFCWTKAGMAASKADACSCKHEILDSSFSVAQLRFATIFPFVS